MNRILNRLAIHSIHNRTDALVYINDEIFLGIEHPIAIFKYLNKKNLLTGFVVDFYKSYAKQLGKDKFFTFIQQKLKEMKQNNRFDENLTKAIWEYGSRNLSFTKFSLALGHFIKNFAGKEAIYIIMPSVTNISLQKLIHNLHNKYPHAKIIDDDTNKVLLDPNQQSINTEQYWVVFNIKYINKNGLDDINNSYLHFNIKNELLKLANKNNIKYRFKTNSLAVGINLDQINSDNTNDNVILDNIYIAIKNAINLTNQNFQENNINNNLQSPERYQLQYYHYF